MSSDRERLTARRPKDFGTTSRSRDIDDEEEEEEFEMTENKFEIWVMPLVAEFAGQLLFTFMHSMSASSVPVIASAFNDGLFVAIMVLSIGHISGAHVNTAVTLAVALSGGMKWIMVPLYVVVQLLGSMAGAGLATLAFGGATGAFALGANVSVGQGVLCEIMLTILLVFAVLMTAVDLGSPRAAFAIGFAIVIDIFAGASISGACMNPSLSLGPALLAGQWANYWVYWVGPLSGALIATGLFRLLLGSRQKRVFCITDSDACSDCTPMRRQDAGESNAGYKEDAARSQF